MRFIIALLLLPSLLGCATYQQYPCRAEYIPNNFYEMEVGTAWHSLALLEVNRCSHVEIAKRVRK